MTPDSDRERLGKTFDRAAGYYQRARPDYPGELFDDLIAVTGLVAGDRLLEVGCATGKATLPLARRGFRITCIEPGPQLAAAARRNLARLGVEIIEGRFEDWRPRQGEQFGLVFVATAWDWVDPAARYAQAWRALRRGELPERTAEIEANGLFQVIHIRHFDWERIYDADRYIELLNSFSGHIAMADWQRERLYTQIRLRLSRRPDRAVRRHWGAVLHIARRRD
jgi:SAM-dependent methyltransferase